METKREWKPIKEYKEILFDLYNGIARITINRERYRNAFTPTTTTEMSDALYICRERQDICVVVLTGAGDKAFCAGGDMHVKGRGGYVGTDGVPRLNVLDVQKQIRSLPKPCGMRPDHRFGECAVRTDGSEGGQFRCRLRFVLSCPLRGAEACP